MLCLAEHSDEGLMSLKRVSELTFISKKYLEQITPGLTAARLVKSVRGAAGGYKLARPASQITFLDVLTCTEGSIAPTSCLAGENLDCNFPQLCIELPVWRGLKGVMEEYLAGVTLQQVLDDADAAAGAAGGVAGGAAGAAGGAAGAAAGVAGGKAGSAGAAGGAAGR